ncbi:hypothetical protein XBP1_1890017 [Xenorhabdus bovienii str. puntauvense]|uniref:Uncharacterized protein n=1 Tax=Xenorhabdus bovienii str. puntauvense TaxID=1398201 RepID=A0A077ND20_XENBV|nr:hypothetical protein XBP1_1890017 [Xenorhabdus bovienii str. puntauvense]
MSFIDAAFYQRTQTAFFKAIQQIISSQQASSYLSPEEAKSWLYQLRNTCFDLFDEYVLSESVDPKTLPKEVKARHFLTQWLFGAKEIKSFMTEYQIERQQKEVINE